VNGLVIDEAVRCSWNRCLTTYALDAVQPKKPTTVERSDLRARKERLGSLLSIAKIEMAGLARLMHQSQYGIMLTDWDGVIVSYLGDPGFSATARRSGFREGVIWSERELGTNGMGTCLVTQRPIVIHRRDHFLLQNTQLTCSAAPIFDMQGKLLASLDISGASARAQTHTLALVDIAAQNIENRALLEAGRRFGLLRFHRCAEFVSTPGEGVLAFDEAGTIRGANRSALKLLGYRNHEALCGQRIEAVLARMSELDLVLQVHGEVTASTVDVFEREARFIDTVLAPLVERFAKLRVVFEHITTRAGAEFVRQARAGVVATITPQHLLMNRNALFAGGLRPHHYCLPVLKSEADRAALVSAATSGNPKFFLGTDSAPHARSAKEAACGCAGIFSAHAGIELYAEAFDAAGALPRLASFAGEFGADFYGLPRNEERITLSREPWTVPQSFAFGGDELIPLRAGEQIQWRIAREGSNA